MNLVERMTAVIDACLTHKGEVSIALSGGSSPQGLYQALSEADLNWSQVTVTLIDDRLVDADHKDSNQRMIAETLLRNRAAAAEFIPLQDWQDDRIPDIAVLGMGLDGHIASLFPSMLGQGDAFDPSAKPAIITTGPEGNPRHERITMTLAMILEIPVRVLMVFGDEKMAVLEAAQAGADMPVTRLLAQDGTSIVTESV